MKGTTMTDDEYNRFLQALAGKHMVLGGHRPSDEIGYLRHELEKVSATGGSRQLRPIDCLANSGHQRVSRWKPTAMSLWRWSIFMV